MAISPSVPRRPWMTFKQAAHYMKFAFGSYGWPYFIGLNNPVLAAGRLLPKLKYATAKSYSHICSIELCYMHYQNSKHILYNLKIHVC